jgi:hypothetical protein
MDLNLRFDSISLESQLIPLHRHVFVTIEFIPYLSDLFSISSCLDFVVVNVDCHLLVVAIVVCA